MAMVTRALCGVLALLTAANEVSGAALVDLPRISSKPSNASEVLDRRLASFSIEFSYLPTFGGNLTNPNLLTKALIERLEERTGLGPDIRPGGITVDSSVFSPGAPAVQLVTSQSGGIYKTIFGPAYFEAFNVFPKSSRVIWSVNLGNNTIGFAQAGIKAALQYIGLDRIYALELGNEADHYSWGSSRPSTWASADYTSQFLGWTNYLTRNLSLPSHIFVAGGFAEDPTSSAPITSRSIIADGVESLNTVKLYAQHTYQYSTCDPARNAIATLANLVSHRNITAYLDLWKPQIAAAKEQGKEFIVGEYSSVSCSGKQNVTDTYGQALWLADTILYGASINIKRLYLHQGATLVFQSSQQANGPGFSWYDLWYPVDSERYGAARASPSFVAYLLVTEALGSSGKTQISLIDVPSYQQLAVYAIWDDGVLKRIVALNTALREATPAALDISAYVAESKTAKVRRMTAPSLGEKDTTKVTWAGQSYAQGVPAGTLIEEIPTNGVVTVQGAEGVLVILS